MATDKQLGQRSQAELEAMFGDMYYGWDRGLVITQERFGNGDTKFEERPMSALELAARFVAAEIGSNIFEIANRAAFAPITVFSQIQARIGPVFEAMEAEINKLRAERDAAAPKWMHAPALPKEYEGKRAWQWNEGGFPSYPFIAAIPYNFSREYKHCKGVWFMLLETPHWSSIEEQKSAHPTSVVVATDRVSE